MSWNNRKRDPLARRDPAHPPNEPRTCKCGNIFRPRSGSLNRTRCEDCQRQREQEKQERARQKRLRPGELPDRREWNQKRVAIKRDAEVTACEVCGTTENALKREKLELAGDHVIPLRIIVEQKLGDANLRINVAFICPSCHAKKKQYEDLLCKGFIPEFLKGVYRLGWPMPKIFAALDHYGLWFPPELRERYAE